MKDRKTFVIACAVLAVDIKHCAQKLGLDVAFKFLEGGLHERPSLLREKLQAAIDEISAGGDCSRIAVGYGICGRGTTGIQTRGIPLAIPKVHDCISLFLGGDAAYQREFQKYPGTYYISAGWYEEKVVPLSQRRRCASYGAEKLNYDELAAAYGEKTAEKTFRFLNSWQRNYQRAAFIETGAKAAPQCEQHAREMAAEYGWLFEKIPGDPSLITHLLTAEATTDDILVAPPHHVIEFDPLQSTLGAKPVWTPRTNHPAGDILEVVDDSGESTAPSDMLHIGLGIDAGGTYTDAVVYDLRKDKVLCKRKALTTKWDFTIGISEALSRLDPSQLRQVEMVSLSTTLATNAIVEGDGQKVGMIIMPPYGLFEPADIPHQPKAVVDGQLSIAGVEIQPVDRDQVKRAVRRMVEKEGVRAFAVSGFAGAINPAHELAVKQIIRDETGLFVTCGHELSDLLNFKTRAQTAMLNARIIPRLAKLLHDLEKVLDGLGITAPVVVVKGDGTLMSAEMAKERPVETILSGPAASVAGARHLTGLKNALVVDMGGTTTDTAALADGAVGICETGSNVGGYATHVKALEIRTAGLGGDSLIKWEKGVFTIGPRRVAPIAWLGSRYPETEKALDFMTLHLNRFGVSTSEMQILALTATPQDMPLTPQEARIVDLLQSRPLSIAELVSRTGVFLERALDLERLEENHIVQRCGLTPTDLLHVTDRLDRWDRKAALRFCEMFASAVKIDLTEMAPQLLEMVTERLTLELLKRQLDEEVAPDALETCPVCQTLIKNMLGSGNAHYGVRIDLKRPVVGIGAPIDFFLPRAAKALGAQAVLPDDAEVANAVGAITSDVVVKRQVRIIPNQEGGFMVEGLEGARVFKTLEAADRYARDALVRMVRAVAGAAGTSCRAVALRTEDQIPEAAFGTPIFLGRVIHASLTGRPDLVMRGNRSEMAAAAY